MSHWTYRIISSPWPSKLNEESRSFEVHEVYFDETGILAVTQKSVSPYGETKEELRADMEKFQEAFNKPVLKMEDLDFVGVDTY